MSENEDKHINDIEKKDIANTLAEEKDDKKLLIPDIIPILPVKNTVAFPGTIMPINVVREKSNRLLDYVLTGEKIIGVVAQQTDRIEDPMLGDLYRIGTVCQILKMLKLPDNTQTIIVHGICRFGIDELTQTQPFWKARIVASYDNEERTAEIDALVHNVRHVANSVMERSPNVPEEAVQILHSIEDPSGLADFLAANLSLSLVHKQELLETLGVYDRLIKVNVALASQLEVLDLSEKLQTQVREQIDKTQKEYYLQEQLRAIRKELGEGDEQDHRTSELNKIKKNIEEAKMPKAVETEAKRELDRMSNISQASPEYSVSLDYVNWLCELPWSVSTEDTIDIEDARKILDEDHYDLDTVKKRILEYLAVRKLNPDTKGPILCFVGPPGVGKTSLGQSIARAIGRKFIRMSLGGVRDEAELRGHRRTYIGSMPGRILQEIRKAGSNNPVFMLDEVDKLGNDFRGDPSSALLEILDPAQNSTFTDNYLSVPFDLSGVAFIATANYIDAVPHALRDRMEIIEIDGYTRGEKLEIAKSYLVPRQIKENGLRASIIKFKPDALKKIISGYTRESGVRNLEREIGSICRAAAVRFASKKKKKFTIVSADIEKYLGPVEYESEVAMRTSVPGVVTALAYTPVGGEILFVEVTRMPGNGNLILTGQVGDVMKESAHAGFSIIRSRGSEWGISDELLSAVDLHIHVPAGAIPKDGPSAGAAMLSAMVSSLTDKAARSDVAMTGEITLRGLVLPVGGIKQKVLAAYNAGIRTIILPERNNKDLVEIPAEIKKQIKFIPVSEINQVLKVLFKKATAKKSTKKKPAKSKPANSKVKKKLNQHATRQRIAAR